MEKYSYKEHVIDIQRDAERAFVEQFRSGNYTFEQPLVVVNPYKIAPLTALVMFNLDEAQSVQVCIKGKQPEGDFHSQAPKATEQFVQVVGLYSGYDNQVELTLEDGRTNTLTITTEPSENPLPTPDYIRTTPEYFGENVMFVSPSAGGTTMTFDYAGDVRWYSVINTCFEIKRLRNGRIMIGTDRLIELPYYVTGLYELGAIGKIYNEYRLPGGFHHDFVEDPEGNLIVLTDDLERGTVEDIVFVLDRETGQTIKTFDSFGTLPKSAAAGNRKSDHDWMHTNAVWYDEASNSITLSSRNLDALVNLDYATGDIRWILGDPGKWPQEYVDKYFFTLEEGQEEFDWFYAQHSNVILPNGDVFVFDNGAWRTKFIENDIPAEEKFSRGVIYRIDTEKRTVRQVWQYGKERGSEFFSPHISNVEYYGPNHYLIHSGDIGQLNGVPCDKPPIFYLGKPEEKDLVFYSITTEVLNDEVVYELKLPRFANFRARKMSLFDAADTFELGVGTLLGTLGVPPQMRLKVPATAQPIPESFAARIDDEIDRLKLTVRLQQGDYAALVLKKGEESAAYLIPTTERDALAMCVGTFQLADENEFFLAISKDGLSGTFDSYVFVEGTLYDLDLQIKFGTAE